MTTISEWWSSSAVLVYDLHREMCCKPSGKVQEGRGGLLMSRVNWFRVQVRSNQNLFFQLEVRLQPFAMICG